MIVLKPCFSEWLTLIIFALLSVRFIDKFQNNVRIILHVPDILRITLIAYFILSLLLIVEVFNKSYTLLALIMTPILSFTLIILLIMIQVKGVRLYIDKFLLFPLHVILSILAGMITIGFLIVGDYLAASLYSIATISIYLVFYAFVGNALWSNVLVPLIILIYDLPWIAYMEVLHNSSLSLTVSLSLLFLSIIPIHSVIKHIKNSTIPVKDNKNTGILIFYPSALSLLKIVKRKKFYEVMDRLVTSEIEDLILITKPFGLVSKLILNYLFLTLSVAFDELKLRSIYEIVVTPTKIVSIPDRFSRRRKLVEGEELVIESRIVGAEPFLITSVIKDKLGDGKSKVIIIDDIADLVYTMGIEKTYKLVRELALAASLINEAGKGDIRLVLFLPNNVLKTAEKKLFINIVDETIII